MATMTMQRAAGGVRVAPPRTPFKRLLVPLDGSELAEHALPFARRLARLLEADLILARAAHIPIVHGDPVAAEVKAVDEAETYLERLSNRYRTDYAVEYAVPFGDPAAELANVAQVRGADLIVMATHGRSGPSRLLLGSVADGLVRKTRLPLLLIRAGLPMRHWEQGIGRILVPLDGSELAESALLWVAALAGPIGTQVTLLQVIGPPMPELGAYNIATLPEDDDAMAEQAEGYLAGPVAWLRERGVETEARVAFGWPATQIAEAARGGYGLIAMSTHGRGGLDRLIVGSVADEVLRRAEVPLMLFRS